MKAATGILVMALCLVPAARGQEKGSVEEKKPEGPEKWEKDMRKFEERDRETPPPEGALLFTGSSSIRKWNLDEAWPELKTINNGFGGSQVSDAVFHFDRCIAPYRKLKAIVIYAGDNDIDKGKDADRVVADFEELDARIRKVHPGVPVVFIAIKPSIKRWEQRAIQDEANRRIAALAAERNHLYFADIAAAMLAGEPGEAPKAELFEEDGLHMSASGYELWKSVVDEQLRRAFGGF